MVNGNNLLVLVESKLVGLHGELDGVLGFEDVVEFLKL